MERILNLFRKKRSVDCFVHPKKVRLELCTLCQLNCRDCYMRCSQSNYCSVGRGYVTFDAFKHFVKMNPFIKEIEISNSGEIFLNPDLEKILEYAFNKKITLCAYNGCNLNSLTERLAEALVKYQFKGLTVSLDGASQEVYVTYRRNGNFDNVISNIKKINKYKEHYNSMYPRLKWQYIIMDTNDDIIEIKKAKQMAKELGMDIFFKRTWNSSYIPRDIKRIKAETGVDYSFRLEKK